jgi:hypothetical protein
MIASVSTDISMIVVQSTSRQRAGARRRGHRQC